MSLKQSPIKSHELLPLHKLAIFVWAVIILSSDLKVTVNPYIHWVASGLLLLPVLFSGWRDRLRIPVATIVASFVFVSITIFSSMFSSEPLRTLGQAAKLFCIVLVANVFFLSRPNYAVWAFKGALLAAWLNFGLLMLGYFGGIRSLARTMTPERWGTCLNFPGSLSKVGVIPFVYAGYGILRGNRVTKVKSLLLMAVCLTIAAFDRSRTAFLVLVGGIVYLAVAYFIIDRAHVRVFGIVFGILLLAVTLIVCLLVVNYPGWIKHLFKIDIQEGTWRMISLSDSVRTQMLRDGLTAIVAHPFVGAGIGSTTTETSIGPMAIHNAYIQSWADLGLLGFLSFLFIIWGWVPYAKRAIGSAHRMGIVGNLRWCHSSIFVLMYYAFKLLFHPLSTEWSEWFVYIVPNALLFHLARGESFEKI